MVVYDLITEHGIRTKLNLGRIATNDCEANEMKSLSTPRYFPHTHVKFQGYVSGTQLTRIEVQEDSKDNPVVDITEEKELNVTFTYSVFWRADKDECKGENCPLRLKADGAVVWRWSNFMPWPFICWYLSMFTALVSGVGLHIHNYLCRAKSPYFTLLGAFLGAGIHLLIVAYSFFQAVKLVEEIRIESLLKFFLGSALFQLIAGGITKIWAVGHGEVPLVTLRDDRPSGLMSWKSRIYQAHLFLIPSTTTWLFISTDSVFSSIWGFKVCGMWGNLVWFSLILVLLTAVSATLSAHHLISDDNSKWQWRHLLHGGMTAAFLFLVGINFLVKANWNDVMERILSNRYLAGMCYAIFVVLGSMSHWCSLIVSRRRATHPHSN